MRNVWLRLFKLHVTRSALLDVTSHLVRYDMVAGVALQDWAAWLEPGGRVGSREGLTAGQIYCINLVRMFAMGGFPRSDPTLSEACCTGPNLYRPIGKFRVEGRI